VQQKKTTKKKNNDGKTKHVIKITISNSPLPPKACFERVFVFRYGIEIEDKTAKTGYIKCKPISTLIGKN